MVHSRLLIWLVSILLIAQFFTLANSQRGGKGGRGPTRNRGSRTSKKAFVAENFRRTDLHHNRFKINDRILPNDRNSFRLGARWDSRGYARVLHNPYFEVYVSSNDMVWSREHGWHSSSEDDEYHVTEVVENDFADSPTMTTTTAETSRPWKTAGSFTGDIKLHCLQRKPRGNCATGIVQMYHRELGQWGTICGERWHKRDAEVVCRYLNFRNGKALKLGPAKIPSSIARMSSFLRNIECEGDEWALTDCAGDQLKRNYTCKSTKLAGVKCSGGADYEEPERCHKSETKCRDGDRCIDAEYVCDGMADCPWGTDEIGCTGDNCKRSEYWCGPKGGGCIPNVHLCDGEPDCIDESDERDCEQFLELFQKIPMSRLSTKKYKVEWQPISPYLCAQKCKEETSFVCSSFDYYKKSQLCLLFSSSASKSRRKSKKWDHYEREGVAEDCAAMNKHRCDDGTCIAKADVCDFKEDCPSGEDEKECEPLKLRLRGGSGPHEGRVEAAKGTKFGLICDTYWTLREADVVCRQLNFSRGALLALKGGAFDRSGRKYVLDHVRCQGNEKSLEDCQHNGWNNAKCNIDHEVGVVCRAEEVPTTRPREPRRTTTTRAITESVTTTPRIETTTPEAQASCGVKPPKRPFGPMARIVGGVTVDPHEWPWQVGIWLPWTYWCGGSLIHPCWVLTAAHCFMRQYALSQYTVRLGDHLSEQREDTEQNLKIARLIKHNYNHTTKENDIALLQIVSESGQCAQLTDEVKTVCLPKSRKQFKVPKNCTITGWGKLSSTDQRNYAYTLQEATIPLIASKKCGRESEYGEIRPTMFCAGYMKGGIDSCQGDSGGPLSCQDEDGRYYVWGIVSWGHGCAKPKAPGVYSDVSFFRNWIREQTGLDL